MQAGDVLRAIAGAATALAPVLPGVGPAVAAGVAGALGLAAQLEDAGVCSGEACEAARRKVAAVADRSSDRNAIYDAMERAIRARFTPEEP